MSIYSISGIRDMSALEPQQQQQQPFTGLCPRLFGEPVPER